MAVGSGHFLPVPYGTTNPIMQGPAPKTLAEILAQTRARLAANATAPLPAQFRVAQPLTAQAASIPAGVTAPNVSSLYAPPTPAAPTFGEIRAPRLESLGDTRLGGLGSGTPLGPNPFGGANRPVTSTATPPISAASFGPVVEPAAPAPTLSSTAPALSATEQSIAAATKPSRLHNFGMGVGGLAGGLVGGMAANAGAEQFAGTAAENPLRAAGAVAPWGGMIGPALAAKLGMTGVGGLAAGVTAPMAGAALAQGFTASQPGNEFVNAARGASDNPVANVLSSLMPGPKAIATIGNWLAPGTFGRTDDTVLDVIPHGNGEQAPTTAPAKFAPGEGITHLTQAMGEFGLRPDLQAQLADTYHQSLVMAKYQGGVQATGPDGKPTMITDPAQIEQALFEQTIAALPQLAAQQAHEDDYNRRATIMQAELERALPGLIPQDPYAASGTSSAPLANALRLIPAQLAAAQTQQDNRSLAAQIQSYQQQAALQQMGLTGGGQQAAVDPLAAAATGAV